MLSNFITVGYHVFPYSSFMSCILLPVTVTITLFGGRPVGRIRIFTMHVPLSRPFLKLSFAFLILGVVVF